MYLSDRLVLRAYRESDLDEMLDMWNEAGVQTGTMMDYVVPRGPKMKETFRMWLDNSRVHFIVETRADFSFVGYVSLRDEAPKNRDCELAITLKTAQWGKGYATEILKFTVDYAFRVLGLHRVSLGVFDTNDRAMNLYKKVGFVEEGRKRKANWIEGEWRDVILMGILEEEWAERKKIGDHPQK